MVDVKPPPRSRYQVIDLGTITGGVDIQTDQEDYSLTRVSRRTTGPLTDGYVTVGLQRIHFKCLLPVYWTQNLV